MRDITHAWYVGVICGCNVDAKLVGVSLTKERVLTSQTLLAVFSCEDLRRSKR